MFLLDGVVVTSASDLTAASSCEFAFLRALDAKLGRIAAVDETPDPMLARAARLGDEHEARVLANYRNLFPGGVVEIVRPSPLTGASLSEAAAATNAAFEARADVVFQATFFDGRFLGFADFIVNLGDGTYEVQDTKLARHAKVTALLQVAAYAEQLERLRVKVGEHVRLVLGDGAVSSHRLRDVLPVYRNRRARLQRIVDERVADTAPVEWGDHRYTLCGRCETCAQEVESHRDLLLVANMRLTQRARLNEAGVFTIEELATSTGAISGISDAALAVLRHQATLQIKPRPNPDLPQFEVFNPSALAPLPLPSEGDIFFDFEGDPLYAEGQAHDWGIDYLFGLVEADGSFIPFWAHTHAEERRALINFLSYVAQRRQQYPAMHIYHFAPYERTHLLSLAARHGIGELEVDNLLRDHVLVDLLPLVRKSVRVGSRSYSLKKLEPLYMGSELRESEVTTAGDSMTAYAESRRLELSGETESAQRILAEIADYNRYDCVSTLRLRDWLLSLATESGVTTGEMEAAREEKDFGEESPLHAELLALAGDPLSLNRTNDSIALALAAAAIDYHRREKKSFWWDHFARLVEPIDVWADTRDVFIVDSAEVERDWYREGRQRNDRRILRLTGQLAPGSNYALGSQLFALYEFPGPFVITNADPGARTSSKVTFVAGGGGTFSVEEVLATGLTAYSALPIALAPGPPPPAGSQVTAIAEWGQTIVDLRPDWPKDAAIDLLRRAKPRTMTGELSNASGLFESVTNSLLDLDNSYVAVQGPPGTGKTYLGAHIIVDLVLNHGWRIGVVAQSHAVVEHMLRAIVDAGLDPASVGKKPKEGSDGSGANWTVLSATTALPFVSHSDGFVLGGTAWTFSNASSVPRKALELLVIDEAGQFSLAYTIASSVSARNILLLGDPQQLPQVSQGTHPEPIDSSALGWISSGHDVLPAEYGFFLPESWRMHSALTKSVSALSYEDQLRSNAAASERFLDGVSPGLHVIPVEHANNSTSSIEEAEKVVDVVREVMHKSWTNASASRTDSPLAEPDIIVVTPYNAQVEVVSGALAAAGFAGIRVGTVDKFQGQEAVVAVFSLAASAPSDVPRGMSFLLLKNRLNVAISRAQWAAYLLYSPTLIDYLPSNAAGLAELSAFITLTKSSV